MSKMSDGGEARDFGGRNKIERDKALAPELKYQREPEDGENINIPNDALGEPISIYAASSNLTGKGEANFTGKFKPVVGRQNLLKNEAGFNSERGKAGVD